MAALARHVARALVTPPFAWRGELVRSSITTVRVTLPAIAIAVTAWGFSGPGLQAGNFLVTFGSIDRAGGFMVVAIMREFGTFVTAAVVAGTGGAAVTAQLRARVVRGGLNPVRPPAGQPGGGVVAA